MNSEEKHGRAIDKLKKYKLHWMNCSCRPCCGLLVGMVKLVKVFVEPRMVKGSVTPVCDIVLNGDKIYITTYILFRSKF